MRKINVTHKVKFGPPKGDLLPLTQCVCGAEGFVISVHQTNPTYCRHCGRGFIFAGNVRVYEVKP